MRFLVHFFLACAAEVLTSLSFWFVCVCSLHLLSSRRFSCYHYCFCFPIRRCSWWAQVHLTMAILQQEEEEEEEASHLTMAILQFQMVILRRRKKKRRVKEKEREQEDAQASMAVFFRKQASMARPSLLCQAGLHGRCLTTWTCGALHFCFNKKRSIMTNAILITGLQHYMRCFCMLLSKCLLKRQMLCSWLCCFAGTATPATP